MPGMIPCFARFSEKRCSFHRHWTEYKLANLASGCRGSARFLLRRRYQLLALNGERSKQLACPFAIMHVGREIARRRSLPHVWHDKTRTFLYTVGSISCVESVMLTWTFALHFCTCLYRARACLHMQRWSKNLRNYIVTWLVSANCVS